MWIVIGIAALYFIYLPFSLFWSGIDKGNGMKRSVTLLKTVKKDLELHKIFARHGMKLIGDGASWRGKTCQICFVVEDGTNARIPPEVEEYLLNNPDLVKGCRIEVQIMAPPNNGYYLLRKNIFSMETFLLNKCGIMFPISTGIALLVLSFSNS